jgi:hypothetical protein
MEEKERRLTESGSAMEGTTYRAFTYCRPRLRLLVHEIQHRDEEAALGRSEFGNLSDQPLCAFHEST